MNNCLFIFAGSNRHILESMFNSTARPFYNSTEQFHLERIPMDEVLEARSSSFSNIMNKLNFKQKETLVAIAKEGKASGVTSVAFVKKHALSSASSVQYAITTLLEDQLLTYEDDGKTKVYSVADRFLGYWIRKNY